LSDALRLLEWIAYNPSKGIAGVTGLLKVRLASVVSGVHVFHARDVTPLPSVTKTVMLEAE